MKHIYLLISLCILTVFPVYSQVFISQYIETNSGSIPKGIEVYNSSGADIVFGAGNALEVYQGTNGSSCSGLVYISSGTLRAGEVWVIGTSNLTTYAVNNGADVSGTTNYNFSFNGDDALQLRLGGVIMDVIGTCGSDPGSQWSGGGVSTANQNIQTISGVCSGTTTYWTNPSLRFETVSTNPVGDMSGFGDAPSSCGVSLPACTAPTQVSNMIFGSITTSSMGWALTSTGADGYLVIRSTSPTLSATPTDGTTYTAGASFGGGTIVSYGTTTSTTVYGLNDGTTYYFHIFAFTDNASCSGGPVYATPAFVDSETTASLPNCVAPSQATNIVFSSVGSSHISGSFTGSGADGYLVIRSTSSTLSANPIDASSYSVGATVGGGTVISNGTSTSFLSTGLPGNTQFYYFVFAYTDNASCNGGPVYATPALEGDTATIPATTNVSFATSSGTANEDDGTYVITIDIVNPYSVATTVDVVLVSGDAARIDNYTTQTIIFPANSSTSQTLTLNITDNTGCDGLAELDFELQNASGGYNAFIQIPSTFSLSISDDDGTNGAIVYQGFEGADTWNYTLSAPDCNDGSGDVWSIETSIGSGGGLITPTVGSNFWAIQDLTGNCGSSAGETITFATESVSGYSNVEVSFQYNAYGFDSGDLLEYQVTIDGVAQGWVTLVNAGTTSGWETETISIPNGSSTVSLELFADQNGADDNAGFDDVTLSGESCNTVCTPPSDPVGSITGTSPACNSTTLIFSGSAPAPATYYWQTVSGGTSLANNAASPLSVSTAGNYYVRAYFSSSACWSDGEAGPFSVTINTDAVVASPPSDEIVYNGDDISFTITAAGATAYQWQVDDGSGFVDISNGGVYSGATTSTLDITGATLSMDTYQYRCVVSSSTPCNDITTGSATLTVVDAVAVPDDGCSSNSYATKTFTIGTSVSITDVNVGVKINTTYRADLLLKLTSPQGTEITIMNSVGGSADGLDAYFDDSGIANGLSSGNHTVDGVYDDTVQVEGGGVSPLSTFNGENSAGVWTLSVCDDASADLAYLLDFEVEIEGCNPTATISSFAPATGPAGTVVTITGTGFTGATAVSFGGVPAATYSVASATTIIAEIPSGANTGRITVADASSCVSTSSTDFTYIEETGTCGSGLSATELFISEVYDADVGDFHLIEIFNGTSAAIDLSDYSVRVNTGAITDVPLNNVMLAAGDVYLLALGNSSSTCTGVTADQSNASGGFNGNDIVYLRKLGTTIDYVPNPNTSSGFSQVRKGTVTSPTTTYNASEWNVSYIESCADLGTGPYDAGPSITIDTEPVDVIGCSGSTATITVVATGSASLTYQWKYNDGTAAGWTDVTTFAGLTVSGATSDNLLLMGDLTLYEGYQFYCEVSSSPCAVATEAVQLSTDNRPIYRTIASGDWSTVAIWEMANSLAGPWVSACTYPQASNSDEVYITNGYTVVLDVDTDVDFLTIEAGGTLELSNIDELTILNSNAGADLIVEGTLYDRASIGNGLAYEDNPGTGDDATWSMGAAGTLVKTNTSSVVNYKDFYEGGMSTIPATANWYYRYNGDGNPITAAVDMFYPNLYFENAYAGNYAWDKFTTILSGGSGYTTVKGDLNLGVTGVGTVTVVNNNFNAQHMIIQGDLYIETGSSLSIEADPNLSPANYNIGYGQGTGFEVLGSILNDGTLDVDATGQGELVFTGTAYQYLLGAGTFDLWDVILNNTSTLEQGTAITINNDAILTTGAWDAAGFDITIGRHWTNTGATFTHGTNKVTFVGAVDNEVQSNGQVFYNVDVNKTSGKLYPVTDNMSVGNTMEVLQGDVEVPTSLQIKALYYTQQAGCTTNIKEGAQLRVEY